MNGMMDASKLLEALGYAYSGEDEGLLQLCAAQAEGEIRRACNVWDMPDDLLHTAANWTVALFLERKKNMGLLEKQENFDYEAAVQQIQEGDTTVRFFEHPSPEQRLEALIDLLKPSKETLLAHRRLKW